MSLIFQAIGKYQQENVVTDERKLPLYLNFSDRKKVNLFSIDRVDNEKIYLKSGVYNLSIILQIKVDDVRCHLNHLFNLKIKLNGSSANIIIPIDVWEQSIKQNESYQIVNTTFPIYVQGNNNDNFVTISFDLEVSEINSKCSNYYISDNFEYSILKSDNKSLSYDLYLEKTLVTILKLDPNN